MADGSRARVEECEVVERGEAAPECRVDQVVLRAGAVFDENAVARSHVLNRTESGRSDPGLPCGSEFTRCLFTESSAALGDGEPWDPIELSRPGSVVAKFVYGVPRG